MDAICFVLGVATRDLRGTRLQDLVYAGDGPAPPQRRADVRLMYTVGPHDEIEGYDAGDELELRRSVVAGASQYRFGGTAVSEKEYHARLRKIGLIARAKNFLVFQGDVESIASQSPERLMAHFEQVSGSHSLADRYDRLEQELQRKRDEAMYANQRARSLRAEQKTVQDQKAEADAYQKLVDDEVRPASKAIASEHLEGEGAGHPSIPSTQLPGALP